MQLEDGRFIDVDGIRTHYYTKGDGPPLVLIHGAGPLGRPHVARRHHGRLLRGELGTIYPAQEIH